MMEKNGVPVMKKVKIKIPTFNMVPITYENIDEDTKEYFHTTGHEPESDSMIKGDLKEAQIVLETQRLIHCRI